MIFQMLARTPQGLHYFLDGGVWAAGFLRFCAGGLVYPTDAQKPASLLLTFQSPIYAPLKTEMVFSTSASSSTCPNVSNPRWKTWVTGPLSHTHEPELPVLCIPTIPNDTSLPYHLSHCIAVNCFLLLPAPTYTLQIVNIFQASFKFLQEQVFSTQEKFNMFTK